MPQGLSFSEFRGYEHHRGQPERRTIEVTLGNPAMTKAYRSGAPGNGKPFTDGAEM